MRSKPFPDHVIRAYREHVCARNSSDQGSLRSGHLDLGALFFGSFSLAPPPPPPTILCTPVIEHITFQSRSICKKMSKDVTCGGHTEKIRFLLTSVTHIKHTLNLTLRILENNRWSNFQSLFLCFQQQGKTMAIFWIICHIGCFVLTP